jgi:hypothetical protein
MTEQTLPADLSEIQALNLLHTLAATDPDYPPVAQQLAPLALVALTPDEQAEIARATLKALNENPQWSPAITTLLNRPPPRVFGADLLSAGLLVAVVFLLRTHIRFEGKARDLAVTIEYKPGDSQTLSALLNKLSTLLPTGSRSL